MMKPKAIVLTAGLLRSPFAKTAHGLIRTSDQYEIIAILDAQSAGKDAGKVLDGKFRNIPIFSNLTAAMNFFPTIHYAIIGVATAGGIIPDEMQKDILEILAKGISVVNGLHTFLSDIPKFSEKAKETNASLVDVRKAKPRSELAFWTGDIYKVSCPIIAVLGTDCALGKRTTTRILLDALRKKGVNAEMIFTGQTGKIQNDSYGFIFDSTLNDFVSGELENAIVQCFHDRKPAVILLEGQASLLNPSGPCGSEYLISANAKKVILQHAPGRKYFEGWEHLELAIPPIEKTIKLIELYDSEVIGICLNPDTHEDTPPLSKEEMKEWKRIYKKDFGVPVVNPIVDGVDSIMAEIEGLI